MAQQASGGKKSRIGKVNLAIAPNFDGFFEEVQRKFRQSFPQAMNSGMSAATAQLEQTISQSVQAGVSSGASGSNGNQIGTQIGNSVGSSAGESLGKQLLSGIAAAGIGAVITNQLNEALGQQSANAKLAAQLGLNQVEAKRAAEVSSSIFSQAYGESRDEVNDALYNIMSSIEGARNFSNKQLEAMGKDTINLATAFELSNAQIVAAADSIMTAGLADTWDEAVDIITKGYQTMGAAGEDWADTLREYSGDFKQFGLDGEQAFSVISSLVNEGGFYNTDTAADFLREVGIQARSGENAEILAQLGLDPEAIKAAANAGGQAWIQAFGQIMTAATASGDKSLLGELFGTQAEDQLNAVLQADWSALTMNLDTVKGAAAELDATLNNTVEGSLMTFQRTIQEAFGAILMPILEAVNPLLVQFATFLKENEAAATAIAVVIAGILVAALVAFTMNMWAANAAILANPMTWIIAGAVVAIGLLVAAIVWLSQNWNSVMATIQGTFNNVMNAIAGAVGWVSGIINSIPQGFQNLIGSIAAFIVDSANRSIAAINAIINALNSLKFQAPEWLGGFELGVSIPNIPGLAEGGTVLPTPGGTIIRTAEAGKPETIVDTGLQNRNLALQNQLLESVVGTGGARSVTYQIYQQPGESTAELVERIENYKEFQGMK